MDITRTHIDRHKLSTNYPLTSSINNISLDIDDLTVKDVRGMAPKILYGINAVRQKYSNDPYSKGKPLCLTFSKKCSRSGHSISTCVDKRYSKLLEKPKFQKQTFNQAMEGNQNLSNKQVPSNYMIVKQLPFTIALEAIIGKIETFLDT